MCYLERCVTSRDQCVTWKGVLTLDTSVSRSWTLSCVCSSMKERKVWRRAGSDTERRKRSRYAVVVITSSSVHYSQSENRDMHTTDNQRTEIY